MSTLYMFVPVAVETMSLASSPNAPLGEEASDFLHDLGGCFERLTCERRATEYLLQRISVAIQRGNA